MKEPPPRKEGEYDREKSTLFEKFGSSRRATFWLGGRKTTMMSDLNSDDDDDEGPIEVATENDFGIGFQIRCELLE